MPQVDVEMAKRTFAAMHEAISRGLLRACHDLSEGGLAVAAAEMAFAGGLGLTMQLEAVSARQFHTADESQATTTLLFSESASRFLMEVAPDKAQALEGIFAAANVPLGPHRPGNHFAKLRCSSQRENARRRSLRRIKRSLAVAAALLFSRG